MKKRARHTHDADASAAASSYFTGYDDHLVHRKMLSDSSRVSAYARAMTQNAEARFRGKVVLDVRLFFLRDPRPRLLLLWAIGRSDDLDRL
jgi:hypothetical protein